MLRCLFSIPLVIFVCSITVDVNAGVNYSDVPGYIVFPLQETEIRLLSISVKIDSKGNVCSVHIFENTAHKKEKIEMAFPNLESWMETDYHFRVKVDGKQLKTAEKDYFVPYNKRLKMSYDKKNYKYKFDKLHSWFVTFQGNERKVIELSYSIQWGISAEGYPSGTTFLYVNKPAALWKGSIEQADYSIELIESNNFIQDLLNEGKIKLNVRPNGYKMIDNKLIEWHFEDWEPNGDIHIEIW